MSKLKDIFFDIVPSKPKRRPARLLFIVKKRLDSYGISMGLVNSATFVSTALHETRLKVDTKLVEVVDGNGIDKEIHDFKPDYVFIEALWATPDKIRELACKYPRVIFSVRIHSKTSFLANEGIAIQYINGYSQVSKDHPNVRMSANNDEFIEDISDVCNCKIDYLPNVYFPVADSSEAKMLAKKHYIDIGCFGALRPMKNHLQQAMAAIKFSNSIGKRLRFHVNSSRTEQRGDTVLKNLRNLFEVNPKHELVEHRWMPHREFIKIIGDMDISMQFSLNESFNIVTADAVWMGVPVAVSDEINWVSHWSQGRSTSVKDMVKILKENYNNRTLARTNKKQLTRYNDKALKVWERHLRSIFK